MIYDLRFSLQANKVAKKWKKSNPTAFKKYAKILSELMEHPAHEWRERSGNETPPYKQKIPPHAKSCIRCKSCMWWEWSCI